MACGRVHPRTLARPLGRFSLRGSGSSSCVLIFFRASEYLGSLSLFCRKREAGLDSMNCGRSF